MAASKLYGALKSRQKCLDQMPIPYSVQLLTLVQIAIQRHMFARMMSRLLTTLPELDFELCKITKEDSLDSVVAFQARGCGQDRLSFIHRSGIGMINLHLNSKKIDFIVNEVIYGLSM